MNELMEYIQLDQVQKDKFIKEVIDELGRRLVERIEKHGKDIQTSGR